MEVNMFVQEVSNKPVDQNQYQKMAVPLLPEDFRVYVRGNTVINHPFPGFEERILPTFNDYQNADGGYVAIYTRNAEKGIYGVGGGIYVIGQVRIPGEYVGRIFIPVGYQPGDDITQDPEILAICEKYIPEMKGDMWVGGDTGGWYGIQLN